MSSENSDVPASVYQALKEKCDEKGRMLSRHEGKLASLELEIKQLKEEKKRADEQLKTVTERCNTLVKLNIEL